MDNWFVLYVRTGSERRVIELLEKHLPSSYKPFALTKAFPIIRKGKVAKDIKLCFPGYIFIRSPNDVDLFFADTAKIIQNVKEAYCILHYGENSKDIAMYQYERAPIERLINADYCMDASLGVIENDAVRITDGLLVGLESVVKRYDHHKRLAFVDISAMGRTQEISLMFELATDNIGKELEK